MRKLREILRLHFEVHLSQRAIARAQGIDHVTVSDVLRRFAQAGLSWPLPADLTDAALEQRLYPGNAGRPKRRPEPDWATVHAELRRKGVTLQLLWQEYRQQCPEGYGYSLFCERYRRYRQTLDVVLRKGYRPGALCFVDYAGDTVPVIHPRTGEIQRAHVFVAILAYSHDTFIDLHPQETTEWWIRGHQDAFAAFRGVPRIVVPDNPRPLVTQADRFDVVLNRSYQACAAHYGVAVIPTRPRRPRDKGKVEAAVLLTERWVLAALRHTRLVGWEGAREQVKHWQDRLNQRPFQKWPGCRATLWATEERSVLRPLPAQPYA